MASSGSSLMIPSSGSEEDLQQMNMADQRKRKRMVSNRESARRSRMRKQNHLDDLTNQLSLLRNEANYIIANINTTAQIYTNIEAENSILRAQVAELTNRLYSLNEIIDYFNIYNGLFETEESQIMADDSFMNSCHNNLFMSQSIMASSTDMFMY